MLTTVKSEYLIFFARISENCFFYSYNKYPCNGSERKKVRGLKEEEKKNPGRGERKPGA